MAKIARAAAAPLSDQPWWVKTVVWVGVPTAVAGVLLWFVLGDFASGMKGIQASMDAHQKDMTSLIQHLNDETNRSWALVSVAQRICLNTAKSDEDRMECVISRSVPPSAQAPMIPRTTP